MVTTNTYKRGDTGPAVSVVCLDGEDPVNLTGATSAKFLMGTIDGTGVSTTKVNGTAAFASDRTTGVVTYTWGATDLNTAGTYKAEVEVTWSGGAKQTFPAGDYLTIIVIADVG